MPLLFYRFAATLKNCTAEQAKDETNQCSTILPELQAGPQQIQTALQITFGVIGAIALIYIVLAGLKMVNSQGRPEAVAQARQSIIYGAVGLVIAAAAEIIVTFVLGSL